MFDLVIEEDLNTVDKIKKPKALLLKASKKYGKVEVYGKLNNTAYSTLIDWLEDYAEELQANDWPILRWINIGPMLLDEDELRYRKHYSATNLGINWGIDGKRVSRALRKIGRFDAYQKGTRFSGVTPDFNACMSQGLIQFKGECYYSYCLEYFTPLFYWLEYYLTTHPNNVRLEFWVTYFNTSASKRFLEFMRVLEYYHTDTKSSIDIYWYNEEGDIDNLEHGHKYQEEISLPFHIITLTKEQYAKMSK